MRIEESISQVIKTVSQKTASNREVRELLYDISGKAKNFLGCDSCTIWLYRDDKKELVLGGTSGSPGKDMDIYNYKEGRRLPWFIFNTKKSFLQKRLPDGGDKRKEKDNKETFGDAVEKPVLGMPIIYKNKCQGVLLFESDDLDYEFTGENLEFAGIVATEVALALDFIGSHLQNQDLKSLSKKRYFFIADFTKRLMDCTSLEEVYKLTTETTMKELNCRTSSIFLFSKEGKLERKYIAGLDGVVVPPEVYERGQGLTGLSAGTTTQFGEPHLCADVKKDHRIQEDTEVKKYVKNYEIAIKQKYDIDEEATHVVTIPLNGSYRTFGVLRIINKIDPVTKELSKDGITSIDKEWLILISNIVATAVANIKKQIRTDAISRINELLSEKSEEEIFDSIADIITDENTSFSACIIRTIKPTKGEKRDHLIIAGASGVKFKKENPNIDIGQGVAGRTFLSGKPEIIENLNKNPKGHAYIEWAKNNSPVSMLCLPLKNVYNVHVGTISIYTKYEYIFDQVDIDYLASFARQVSNVIQIIQEKRELRFINKISEQINRKDDILGILDTAAIEIPYITGSDICVVKREKDSYRIIASSHKEAIGAELSDSNPVVLEMEDRHRILTYRNVERDDKFEEIRKILRNIKSMALIPIITANKKLYGIIILAKLISKEAYADRDISTYIGRNIITQLKQNFYQALANQIAMAVDKNNMVESLRDDYRRKDVINQLIQKISMEENLEINLKTIFDEVGKILDADVGFIALLSKASKTIEPTCLFGINFDNFPNLEIDGDSITGWVYNNKKAYLWPSGTEEVDSLYVPFNNLGKNVKTEIIAPLLYREEVIGVLEVGSYEEQAFNERDKLFLKSVADQIAVIIQNKKFYLAAENLAEITFDEKDVKRNCNILAENADKILDNSITCLWLKKILEGKNYLVMESWHSVQIKNRDEYNMLEGEGGISWQTAKSKKEIIIPEGLSDPKHGFKHQDFVKKNKLESMISIPLIAANEVIGTLNSYSRRNYRFLDKEVYLLKNLAAKGAIAIKNAELKAQMEDINEKILDSAQLANPGQVAMSFTHDAKHTMHNINALISSLIYLLPEKVLKTKNAQDIIASLTNDTDYLRNLFNSLVKYARKSAIDYKPSKLREIIEYILHIYHIRLKKNNVECEINYADDELKEVEIECDRNQIEQVLLNLFNNSIYAIREKMSRGGHILIYMRDLDDEYVEIQFKDNGIGISEKDKVNMFEPFFTTKGEKGSGFGLAICKRIIEDNHLGKISVKSTTGEYTTFYISLSKIQKRR